MAIEREGRGVSINRGICLLLSKPPPTIDKQFSSFLACLAKKWPLAPKASLDWGDGMRGGVVGVMRSPLESGACWINNSNFVWIQF